MHTPRVSVRKFVASLILVTCSAVSAVAIHSPAAAAISEQHCAAKVGDATSKPGATVCFKSLAESISFATGGAVRLPVNATSVTEEQLEQGYAKSATAAIVIGLSYWNTGYRGSTFTHYADTGCDNDLSREWYFQFPTAWNDKAGSGTAYSSCRGTYWEIGDTGTSGGGVYVFTDWSGGAMNDNATFIEWV